MKLVRENIEFKRGRNIYTSLNIGQRSLIKKWFDDVEKEKGYKIDYIIDDSLNIKVSRSLNLRGTTITSLPDNLSVGRSLDLEGTKIISLPDNLSVGGYLDLRYTNITSLPDNLIVGVKIYKDF